MILYSIFIRKLSSLYRQLSFSTSSTGVLYRFGFPFTLWCREFYCSKRSFYNFSICIRLNYLALSVSKFVSYKFLASNFSIEFSSIILLSISSLSLMTRISSISFSLFPLSFSSSFFLYLSSIYYNSSFCNINALYLFSICCKSTTDLENSLITFYTELLLTTNDEFYVGKLTIL